MSRKPSRKRPATKAKPNPAQLEAIERLLEQGDSRVAARRAKALVRQFPDHGGLRRSLVAALHAAQGPGAAGLAALQWAEQRRNSLQAQEMLLYYAAELSRAALVGRAARRVRELGGEVPVGVPDAADLEALGRETLDPGSSLEDLERFEIAQLHLTGQDLDGALRWLDAMEFPTARNNRGVALFHLQRADEALALFLDVWQEHPENLFALSWAAQVRLYSGDEGGALGLCTPLAAGVPVGPDHALAQIQVLLLMQQNEPALEAFRTALDSDWEDASSGRAAALLRHYGACAACRLGNGREARRLWREALGIESGLHLAQANLDALRRVTEPTAFPQALEVQTLFPVGIISILGDSEQNAALDRVRVSNTYLEAAYRSGNEGVRALVSLLLRFRAGQGDTDAVLRLEAFARLPIGTKSERLGYLTSLREQGVIAREAPMEIWGDDGLVAVELLSTIVEREPVSSGLPMDLDVLLIRSFELMQEGRVDEAAPLLDRVLERAPGHPVATGNLAALREMQGRREEVRPLLRQVVAEHPDYLHGRCNLARLLIIDGKLEEAQGLLAGLAERERIHVNDMFTLYGTLAMLHMAKGDDTAAKRFLASLEPLVETEDDERHLAQVRALTTQVMPKGMFGSILQRIVASPPRPYKGRR